MSDETQAMKGNYFAYGSNLLASRMHVHNKDAIKSSLGRLKDWKLTFSGFSHGLWHGATANIVPSPGDEVIGVIWSVKSFGPLDEQEVHYSSIDVPVVDLKSEEVIKCRTYIQEACYRETSDETGLPSKAYHNVIMAGARESCLPVDYIDKLMSIENNGVIPEKIASLVPESLGS